MVPVIAVDGNKIGSGLPGVVSRRVCEKFLEMFARI
jgi:hypothetical protein